MRCLTYGTTAFRSRPAATPDGFMDHSPRASRCRRLAAAGGGAPIITPARRRDQPGLRVCGADAPTYQRMITSLIRRECMDGDNATQLRARQTIKSRGLH